MEKEKTNNEISKKKKRKKVFRKNVRGNKTSINVEKKLT